MSGLEAYQAELVGAKQTLEAMHALPAGTRYVVPAHGAWAPPPGLVLGPAIEDLIAQQAQTVASIEARIAELTRLRGRRGRGEALPLLRVLGLVLRAPQAPVLLAALRAHR